MARFGMVAKGHGTFQDFQFPQGFRSEKRVFPLSRLSVGSASSFAQTVALKELAKIKISDLFP